MAQGMIKTKSVTGDRLHEFLMEMKERGIGRDELVFLCIGTDRSSGDALGPLTGTLLREAGFHQVVGTLESPCDASNWQELTEQLPADRVVLAIDACLGSSHTVGMFQVKKGPIEPGKSLQLGLNPAGQFSIAAIVNENRAHPMRVLETTSVGRILSMSRQIVQAVLRVFPE